MPIYLASVIHDNFVLGMVMQMIFNPAGGHQGPNKSEGLDDNGIAPSPWANLLAVGLKILSAFLGGGAAGNGDGIDKVDNGSPMQVCTLIPLITYLKFYGLELPLVVTNTGSFNIKE